MFRALALTSALAVPLLSLVGCGEGESVSAPEAYAFGSRFGDGSSVAYLGQTTRHLLIADLRTTLDGLTEEIEAGRVQPEADGDVRALLDFYFDFDGESVAAMPPLLSTSPGLLQTAYGDLSTAADLRGKTAGNDPSTDHVDWASGFRGWSDDGIAADGGGVTSPTLLVEAFFETVDAQALAYARDDGPVGPGDLELPVTVTPEGLDLAELTETFLLGALALHQASDDHLHDDVEGEGLLADHVEEAGEGYTALEHAWDEAFGYFGAARDFGAYDLDRIADTGFRDSDRDGAIDLRSELCFGASVTAAERDRGSAESSPTAFVEAAWTAFRIGRARIASWVEPPTRGQLNALRVERNAALQAWEAAYAATVVHAINATLRDMSAIGTDDYDFLDHAEHWSEMKGHALSFQFNPRSPLTEAQFESLHAAMGDRPVLEEDGEEALAAYRLALLDIRAFIGLTYLFDPINLGDDEGRNGW